MTFKRSVHIEAPVEKVFDFFRDPMNSARILTTGADYKDIKITKEGLGTNYTWSSKIVGVPISGFGVYTEFEPNRRITEKESQAFVGTWTYTFEPEGSGTKLTMECEPHSVWRIPPLSMLGDQVRQRIMSQFLPRLKHKLEGTRARRETTAKRQPAATAKASRG